MNDVALLTSLIGRNLNAVRSSRGLTFDQLAKMAEVSKGMLVQIEQGRTNPSVGILCKIANALGVAVSRFIETTGEPRARVIPASEATELWTGRKGSSGSLLVGFEDPSLTEVWEWRLVPSEFHDGIAHPAGTREVLYVRKGQLSLSIDGMTHKAKPTDVLTFVADRPHRYANEGTTELLFLMVVSEPDLRFRTKNRNG